MLAICLLNLINISPCIKQYSIAHGQINVTLCLTYLLNNKSQNTCFLTICFYRLWSMLARDFSCAMLAQHLQQSVIIKNLTTTDYYQKINCSKIKITEKWPDVVQTTLYWIFSCAIFFETSRILHCVGFFLCNIVSGALRQHCTWFFPV